MKRKIIPRYQITYVEKIEHWGWYHDGHNDYDKEGRLSWVLTYSNGDKAILQAEYSLGRNGVESERNPNFPEVFLTEESATTFIANYEIDGCTPRRVRVTSYEP